MKRIIAILTIIMVFILPFSVTFNEQKAHANIISKPLTITAKKVAKELAQNSAVEMAEHILFEKAMKDFLNTDLTEPGYKAVCLDGAKSYDDCPVNKRGQIKETLTSSDKAAVAKKVEQVLEQKTNTSSKWTKFLDWFVPIFLVSGLVASFDAMLDPESEGLLDDIAQQSLIETGLLKQLNGQIQKEIVDFRDAIGSIENVKISENQYVDTVSFDAINKLGVQYDFTYSNQYGTRVTNTVKSMKTYNFTFVMSQTGHYATSPPKFSYELLMTNFNGASTRGTRVISKTLPYEERDKGAQELRNYLNTNVYSKLRSGDVNSAMNAMITYLNDYTGAGIEFSLPKIQPSIEPDFGTQTGVQHIKNPDGTVKTPGIENFKYTYNNSYVYPSPDSTTGWKDKATDIDIAVVEDDVIVDGGEPPIDPEAPPAEDDDINTDKDKDKIKKKSRDWSALLTTRFPFSLPWDFLHLMKFLYAEPMTPNWEVKGTEKIPFNLKIDLKFMEPYAPWFRTFIFLSFVMSVIFLHGRFMGGSK